MAAIIYFHNQCFHNSSIIFPLIMEFTLWLPAYQKETEVPGSEAESLGVSSCLVYKPVSSLKRGASTCFSLCILRNF